jgi:hypothetical protein
MTVRAHLNYVNFHIFRSAIENKEIKDTQIKKHLELLVRILALDTLIKDGAPSFDSGYWGRGALNNLQKALDILLVQLRPQILNLTEAMHCPDHVWPTVLGN